MKHGISMSAPRTDWFSIGTIKQGNPMCVIKTCWLPIDKVIGFQLMLALGTYKLSTNTVKHGFSISAWSEDIFTF